MKANFPELSGLVVQAVSRWADSCRDSAGRWFRSPIVPSIFLMTCSTPRSRAMSRPTACASAFVSAVFDARWPPWMRFFQTPPSLYVSMSPFAVTSPSRAPATHARPTLRHLALECEFAGRPNVRLGHVVIPEIQVVRSRAWCLLERCPYSGTWSQPVGVDSC